MGKYTVRISRFEPFKLAHRDKAYRASIFQNDLAILKSHSDFLQLDLAGAEDFVPRMTDFTQKTFKSRNLKIRNCAFVYWYSDSSINVKNFSMDFEIRVKGDDLFVVNHFDDLVTLVRQLNATRAYVEPVDPFMVKRNLQRGHSLIYAVSLPEMQVPTYNFSTFDFLSSHSYPYACNYASIARTLEPSVEKVAQVENGVLFCAPKAWMDQEEYYQWNRSVLTALGLYGYGNMPTTRRCGTFYWDREVCPEFFANLPDDLAERLYAETPLVFRTHIEPISYCKDQPTLSLELPGIEDEAGEKAFWDLHLAKHLGPYEVAVHTMMHQYDRFL